jgi:hypothetical protein
MSDRTFDSGARRSRDADSYRYDLITPIGLRRVAATYAEGAGKYAEHNWELGMPIHDLLNHVCKHIYDYLSGDRTEDHLAHGAWGMLAAIHSEEKWPHLNEHHMRGPGCTLTEAMKQELQRQLQQNLARRQAEKEQNT